METSWANMIQAFTTLTCSRLSRLRQPRSGVTNTQNDWTAYVRTRSEDNLRLEDIMTWYGQSLVVGSREGVEINDHGQAVFPKEIEHDQGSC